MSSFDDEPFAMHAALIGLAEYARTTSHAHRAVEKRIRQLDAALSGAELELADAANDLSRLRLDDARFLPCSPQGSNASSPDSSRSNDTSSSCSSADTSAGDFELYRWLFDQGIKTIRPGSPLKLRLPDVPSCPLLRGASHSSLRLSLDNSNIATNDYAIVQSQSSWTPPTPTLSDAPTLNSMPSLKSSSSRTSSRHPEPLSLVATPSLTRTPSVAASLEVRLPTRPSLSRELAQRAELLKTPHPRPNNLEHQYPKFSPSSACELHKYRVAHTTPRKPRFMQSDASMRHWQQKISSTGMPLSTPPHHSDQFADAEGDLTTSSLPLGLYEGMDDSSIDNRADDGEEVGDILTDMNDVFTRGPGLQHQHSFRAMGRFKDVLNEFRLRYASVFSSSQPSPKAEEVVVDVSYRNDSPDTPSTPPQEISTPPSVSGFPLGTIEAEQSTLAASLMRQASLYDANAEFLHELGVRLEQLGSRNRLVATQLGMQHMEDANEA